MRCWALARSQTTGACTKERAHRAGRMQRRVTSSAAPRHAGRSGRSAALLEGGWARTMQRLRRWQQLGRAVRDGGLERWHRASRVCAVVIGAVRRPAMAVGFRWWLWGLVEGCSSCLEFCLCSGEAVVVMLCGWTWSGPGCGGAVTRTATPDAPRPTYLSAHRCETDRAGPGGALANVGRAVSSGHTSPAAGLPSNALPSNQIRLVRPANGKQVRAGLGRRPPLACSRLATGSTSLCFSTCSLQGCIACHEPTALLLPFQPHR